MEDLTTLKELLVGIRVYRDDDYLVIKTFDTSKQEVKTEIYNIKHCATHCDK